MKALSIRQPWAWLIIHAGKDIENRTWPSGLRGPVLIHAAKTMTLTDYDECAEFLTLDPRLEHIRLPRKDQIIRGGIIGQVNIFDCVQASDSPWFVGPWGFRLGQPEHYDFAPCRGALGFFRPQFKPQA